jgi:hypothetical protein
VAIKKIIALALMLSLCPWSDAAISRDATGLGPSGTASATATWTHVNAGNFMVVVVRYTASTDDITSCKYNSVSMTQRVDVADTVGDRFYAYTMQNPAIGSHSVTCTSSSSSNQIIADSVSYFSVNDFDVFLTSSVPNITSQISETFVTTQDNDWATVGAWNDCNFLMSNVSNSTLIITGNDGSDYVFDSNAAFTPAGSHTMTQKESAAGCDGIFAIAIAFSPSGGASPSGLKKQGKLEMLEEL